MRLYLMRHGIAAEIGGEIKTDAERPLTPEGHAKTQQATAGVLRCGIEPELIATSPLLRAHQTAEIVNKACRSLGVKPAFETWPELVDAEYSGLLSRLQNLDAEAVLLVGHEPGLSHFASQLLTGSPTGLAIELKKASLCAIDLEIGAGSVAATLLWHAPPRQLRLMGK